MGGVEQGWTEQMRRPLYSWSEGIRIYYLAISSVYPFEKAKLQDTFVERLMLAVTAVNKCPMCSYAHTEIALKSGMAKEEIENLLGGSYTDCPPEEGGAILFAQHYAEKKR